MKRKCCVSVTVPDILANYDSTGPVLDYDAIFNRPRPQQPQQPRPQDPIDGTQSSDPYIPIDPIDVPLDPVEKRGCTNKLAVNYDPDASVDDGSCLSGTWSGGAQLPQSSDPEVVVSGEMTDALERPDPIVGCTNPAADNYNPYATVASGIDDPGTGYCTYSSFDDEDSSGIEPTPGWVKPSSDSGYICGSDGKFSRGPLSEKEIDEITNLGYLMSEGSPRKFKIPPGMVISEAELCRNVRYCDYSSSENLLVGEMVDLSGLLMKFGLPPLPSLDKSICTWKKDEIIDGVLRELDSMRGAGAGSNILDREEVASFWDATKYAEDSASIFNNFLDLATAAIRLGRGEMGEVLLDLLDAIPLFGNLFSDALEKIAGNVIRRDTDSLPWEIKQRIIDGVIDAMAVAALIPNPATPVTVPLLALTTSAIMFGRQQWDEAVMNILMLGLAAGASKWAGILFGRLKDFIAKMKPGVYGEGTIAKAIQDFFKWLADKIMRKLVEPLKDIMIKSGNMDAAGNLTAQGLMVYDEAKILANTILGVNDFFDGAENI